jgi:integrase
VGQFLTAWLEDAVKPSVRPKTYRSYEQMVRCHLVKNLTPEEIKQKGLDNVSSLGALPLTKLTLQVVQRWLNDKLKAGNSPSLVAYLRTVLRAAMAYAVRDDLLPRNPAALARPPRVERREVVPFNPEQAGKFLQAAMGHRLEALFTCALAVGLRSGEASALRWEEDVDLDAGQITVHHTLQRQKGVGLVLVPPKSDKGRRTVELPAVCVNALKRHRETQRIERQLAGNRWQETGHPPSARPSMTARCCESSTPSSRLLGYPSSAFTTCATPRSRCSARKACR